MVSSMQVLCRVHVVVQGQTDVEKIVVFWVARVGPPEHGGFGSPEYATPKAHGCATLVNPRNFVGGSKLSA